MNGTDVPRETAKSNTEGPEAGNEVKQPKIDLDTILVEEVGQFGLFQVKVVLLAILAVIFNGWAASEFIFTTSRINTRCLIPECESRDQLQFSPSWILNAVPESGSGFDNCWRFANMSVPTREDTCPASLFNQELRVPCEEYVYENTHSIVYDYELACDEWRRSLIGSVRTVGTLVALPIVGFVSDRWGRRTALALSGFNLAWIGILRYWAGTYVGFMMSEFAEAAFGSGVFSCCYILMMEVMGPKYRVAAGATMNSFFAVGQVTMGLIAWGVPNWRHLTLVLYIPMLLFVTYFWLMSESVRWYMSKGRYEESEKVIKEIALTNGTQVSEKSLMALRQTGEEEKKKKLLEKAENKKEPWLIVLVFQHKPILLRCATSPVWWITTTFIYYGLSINAVNMSGNRYLNYVAVSAVEIPGYWTAFLLIGIIGRKPVLIGAFFICAACQIAYIFMPDGNFGVSLTVYLIGKCSIAAVMTTIYVYTNELYPTRYRHSLFAFSSMIGRIGSILAPLTPALADEVWEQIPFALFGGMALLSGCLVLLTPETLGCKLPDTMEEAANIGKKSNETSSLLTPS